MARSFQDDYTLGSLIAEGGHGMVYDGYHNSDNKPVVVKIIQRSRHDNEEEPTEVTIMKMLAHVDGVCKVIDWYQQNLECRIIMEKLENVTDLFYYIDSLPGNKIPESVALKIFRDLFNTVLILDEMNLVHRDIKTENILINKTTLKTTLIDFDSCTFNRNKPFRVFSGTSIYYPPEWYINKMCSAEPMTVWSLGLVLYNMITGRLPFDYVYEITTSEINFSEFSSPVEDLLRCMLIKEEQYRYGYHDIQRALNV